MRRRMAVLLVASALLAGCATTSNRVEGVASASTSSVAPASSTEPPIVTARESDAAGRAPTSSAPGIVVPAEASDTASRDSVPPTTTRYLVPVADADRAGWSPTHATYPATDIFDAGGCGGTVVSPVDGVVLEVRTVDSWDPAVDDPATRGGRSVAIRGHDGVRYYMAHFASIGSDVVVGRIVEAGTPLGTVGDTGRTSACHVHFGISPPCPDTEWSVRRGVVWPYPYFDAWRAGQQLSPAAEVRAWVAANPDACALASADG